MIEKQRKLDGEAIISTVLFNHETFVVHDRINLNQINMMDHETYYVGGMTALLDAVGKSIRHIRNIYAETLKEERPSKVIFVITTDGLENASQEKAQKLLQAYGIEHEDIWNILEEHCGHTAPLSR